MSFEVTPNPMWATQSNGRTLEYNLYGPFSGTDIQMSDIERLLIEQEGLPQMLPKPYSGIDIKPMIEQMQTDIDELEKPIPVLNGGFAKLIDYMGTDESISQAARVSYAKGTRKVSEDRDLIRFLMRHEHYSPFSMAQVKFHLRLPLFVHNQFVR